MSHPVIVIHTDIFDDEEAEKALYSLYYTVLRDLEFKIIIWGPNMHHKEEQHKFLTRMYKRIPNYAICEDIVDFVNKPQLRKKFIMYYSEEGILDFDKLIYLSKSKRLMTNNITFEKHMIDKIKKHYSIVERTEECYLCEGTGEGNEHYDACGCVDYVDNCKKCGGTGHVAVAKISK